MPTSNSLTNTSGASELAAACTLAANQWENGNSTVLCYRFVVFGAWLGFALGPALAAIQMLIGGLPIYPEWSADVTSASTTSALAPCMRGIVHTFRRERNCDCRRRVPLRRQRDAQGYKEEVPQPTDVSQTRLQRDGKHAQYLASTDWVSRGVQPSASDLVS